MKTVLRRIPLRPGLLLPACRSPPPPSASALWPASARRLVPCRRFAAAAPRRPQDGPESRPFGLPKKQSLDPLVVIPRPGNRITKLTNIELDSKFVTFDNIFLRDACTCPRCVDPSTQQKLFQTSDIPGEVMPKSMRALPSGTLVVYGWENDAPSPYAEPNEPHISTYDVAFLRKYAELRYRLRRNYNDRRQVLWDSRLMMQDMLWIDYDDYMTSDLKLFEAVNHLSLYGLIFLRGVPETPTQNAVEGIAERIGNIRSTFYGRTWDVKFDPDAKNIAYTALELGLHMDLLYLESPPGLQFLHCIRNTVSGGTSIFADSFRAATAVRMSFENQFRSLCSFPVTYHYRNDGHHYHYSRPTVVLEPTTYMRQPRISHVNWSPPFQAPFETNIGVTENAAFRQYYGALRHMAASLEEDSSVFEITLGEGECAVFANRRVVHGRRAFDPRSGERWLKGTYVDVDAFLSKYRMLSERFSRREDRADE